MGATCGAGSAYPSGAPEITLSFWWGSCCLVFSFLRLCCVFCANMCLFVFLFVSHDVVSLFSIHVFDCPSDIFCSSFTVCLTAICHCRQHFCKSIEQFHCRTCRWADNIPLFVQNLVNLKYPIKIRYVLRFAVQYNVHWSHEWPTICNFFYFYQMTCFSISLNVRVQENLGLFVCYCFNYYKRVSVSQGCFPFVEK